MKELVTAEEIQDAIMSRITAGQYSLGDRLPSVRDLAAELGANRNTVHKAYQMLAELGLIESTTQGRKGFWVKDVSSAQTATRDGLRDYFYQQALNLVWQGMAAGMTAQTISDQLAAAVRRVYHIGEIKLVFYECNTHDSTEMGRQLSVILELPVACGVLDDLYAHTATIAEQYDLIITTFHHLAEVNQAVGATTNRVVGIDTRPDTETMLKIARLPTARIGLICTLETTLHMLKHMMYSYYPQQQLDVATHEDVDAVRRIAAECDYLVVTHTCADEVQTLTRRSADIVVNFRIDEQSVQFLKRRIHTLKTEKFDGLQIQLT